jgi:hypothetical protein
MNDTPQTATICLRTLAAISAFCSTDPTRYYLGGVLIEVDANGVTYVAADGHRIAARRLDLHADDARNTLTGQWIIPAGYRKAFNLRKSAPPKGDLALFGEFLSITHEDKPVLTKPIDGDFPEWRRCIPATASGSLTYFSFNAKYFLSVSKFAEDLNLGAPRPHWNEGGPTAFSFEDKSAFCVLMPLRVSSPEWSPPAWLSAGAPQ